MSKLLSVINSYEKLEEKSIKDFRYIDPDTIVDVSTNKYYTLSTKDMKTFYGNLYNFPNYRFNKNLWKLNSILWSDYTKGKYDDISLDNNTVVVIGDDDEIESVTESSLKCIIDVLKYLDNSNYDIKLLTEEGSSNLEIEVGNGDLKLYLSYLKDSNYLTIYEGLLLDYNDKLVLDIASKSIFKKYLTDDLYQTIIDNIEISLSRDYEAESSIQTLMIDEVKDSIEEGISFDELLVIYKDWIGYNLSSDTIDSISDDNIRDLFRKFYVDEINNIPNNRLKKSVTFSSTVTYKDMLSVAKDLLYSSRISLDQYLDYYKKLLTRRTNRDYLYNDF